MAEVLQEGVESGHFRPLDPELVAFVAGQTLFTQPYYAYEDVLPLYVDVLLNEILPR